MLVIAYIIFFCFYFNDNWYNLNLTQVVLSKLDSTIKIMGLFTKNIKYSKLNYELVYQKYILFSISPYFSSSILSEYPLFILRAKNSFKRSINVIKLWRMTNGQFSFNWKRLIYSFLK